MVFSRTSISKVLIDSFFLQFDDFSFKEIFFAMSEDIKFLISGSSRKFLHQFFPSTQRQNSKLRYVELEGYDRVENS